MSFSFDGFEQWPAEPDMAEARRQALGNRADILSAPAEYAASQSNLQFATPGIYYLPIRIFGRSTAQLAGGSAS